MVSRMAFLRRQTSPPVLNHSIPPESIVGIDFLRGAFAILVLLSHSVEATVTTAEQSIGHVPEFWLTIENTFGRGAFWVFGFFVISGFCIQLSVNRSLSQSGGLDSRRYLLARFTRIFPLYAIGLALAVAIWLIGSSVGSCPHHDAFPWQPLLGNLFLVQGFGDQFPGYGPSWSITNEFVYYLALPALLLIAGNRPGRALSFGVAINLILASLVVVIWKSGGEMSDWMIPFWTVPALSILWFAGAFLAEYWHRIQSLTISRWFLPLAGLAMVLAFASYAWLNASDAASSVKFLHSYASIIAFSLLILATARLPWLKRPRVSRVCHRIGLLSYPLYLFHAPIQSGIRNLGLDGAGSWPLVFSLLSFFVIPLAITILAGVRLETFFLRKRKEWMRRAKTAATSEAVPESGESKLPAPTTG